MHAPGYILVGYRRLLHVRLIPDTNRSLLMHARAEVKSRFFIYVSYTLSMLIAVEIVIIVIVLYVCES